MAVTKPGLVPQILIGVALGAATGVLLPGLAQRLGLLGELFVGMLKAVAPLLVMVHGGPGGQAIIGYNALKQYLVNHGYAIFDINNRGSSKRLRQHQYYEAQDKCRKCCVSHGNLLYRR